MAQKLYTEEQVIDMLNGSKMEKHLIYEFLKKYYTPIELPSDEEIWNEMDKLPFSKHIDDGMFNDGQLNGFELGAKWLKYKILNK